MYACQSCALIRNYWKSRLCKTSYHSTMACSMSSAKTCLTSKRGGVVTSGMNKAQQTIAPPFGGGWVCGLLDECVPRRPHRTRERVPLESATLRTAVVPNLCATSAMGQRNVENLVTCHQCAARQRSFSMEANFCRSRLTFEPASFTNNSTNENLDEACTFCRATF